jgi:hypothetical protein
MHRLRVKLRRAQPGGTYFSRYSLSLMSSLRSVDEKSKQKNQEEITLQPALGNANKNHITKYARHFEDFSSHCPFPPPDSYRDWPAISSGLREGKNKHLRYN